MCYKVIKFPPLHCKIMQKNEECYLKYCYCQLLTKVPITLNPTFRIDAIMKVLSFQVESMCVC